MKWFILIITLLSTINSHAQKHDYIWFLGQESIGEDTSSVLNFNYLSPRIDSFKRNLVFFRTNTSMCDSLGNLLFYTNGFKIYNSQKQLMQNGDSINPGLFFNNNHSNWGNAMPEGSIAIPHPNQPNKYYLFHQTYIAGSGNGGFLEKLLYSVIDMNANNGLGSVEVKNVFLTSDSICTGQLEAIKHGNGHDWWIIQPMEQSNGYHTFLITGDSIIKKPNQYIGNYPRFKGIEWLGQSTFSPNGHTYVRYDQKNDLEIFDFDRCNGKLSNYLHIPIIDTVDNTWPNAIPSGVAISANNRFLYITSYIYVYQFDLLAPNISNSKDTVATYDGFLQWGWLPSYFGGYAQLAPDNRIIFTNPQISYLHSITTPDSLGLSCNVQQHSSYIYYNTGFSIPNFPHYRTQSLPNNPCGTFSKVVKEKNSSHLKIYPNPASHKITIEFEKENINKSYSIEILNSFGKVILLRISKKSITNVNIKTLSKGIYICKITCGKESISKKIIVN